MKINWNKDEGFFFCLKEAEELLQTYNEVEKSMGWPEKGTYLYAICDNKPFIILVRDGQYVSDVHSANLAVADFRFDSRCGYYNSPNKVRSTLWKEIVHSAESDLEAYCNPTTGNYCNETAKGMLRSRITKMSILKESPPVCIELREDSIIIPKDFKNYIYKPTLECYSYYKEPRLQYVEYKCALTFPETNELKYGPCFNETVTQAREQYNADMHKASCKLNKVIQLLKLNSSLTKEERDEMIDKYEDTILGSVKKPEIYDGIYETIKIIRR